MRYEQVIVFVGGAHYEHVRIHERYRSTYIPLGPVGHSPRLPSARDPFDFRQNSHGCDVGAIARRVTERQ